MDAEVWKFLEDKDPHHLCKLYFKTYVECDSIDNNMAEMLNGVIIEARFKPIVSMLEEIHEAIMKRLAVFKTGPKL